MVLTISHEQAKELIEDADVESVRTSADNQSDVMVTVYRKGVLAVSMTETGHLFLDMWFNGEL